MGAGGGDRRKEYLANFMSELIGTALLMFLGCMGCITVVDNPPAVHHMSGLAFGLVILIIIQIFGHISGAHLNPAVTICALILKLLTPAMAGVYVMAQFLGAILGFSLLKILVPQEFLGQGFCITKPNISINPIQCLGIETIITAVLILVCCGVWDKRNAHKHDSIPIRFGFIIAAIAMVAGPFTGASMNTARSFVPALFERDFVHQWIYWVGPNLGAILGSLLYIYLFEYKEEDDHDVTELEDFNESMIVEKS